MTVPRVSGPAAPGSLGRTERQTVKLSVQILEARAERSERVVISAAFARVLARYLRTMLGRGD